MLSHPDMKRFSIPDPALFVPPRPSAWISALSAFTWGSEDASSASHHTPQVPSFGDFFGSYFGSKQFSLTEPKANLMLEGLKKCYENHAAKDPASSCQYYISGFERFAVKN